MRILELTAHVHTLSRRRTLSSPQGESATAAAAYRACAAIRCERTGRVHDYRRKGGLVASGIEAPEAAPDWAKDRASLWNAAEMRERNKGRGPNAGAFKANAVVAREFLYGFPAELSAEGRLRVAQEVARHMVARYGVAADYAIHAPGTESDQRNHHCHMLVTSRRMEVEGLTVKTREWDAQANGSRHVKAWRAYLAKTLNDALAAEGKGGRVFVEHRSFKDRGSSQKPTRHQGKHKTHGPRKMRRAEREAWQAREQAAITERHRQERSGLSARQEAAEALQARESAERQARVEKALTDDLARREADDQPKSLAARMLDRLAGRSGQARQAALERIAANRTLMAELAAAIEEDRRALSEHHRREARTQDERHRSDAQQIEKAAAARVAADRAAEVQARRDDARRHEQEQRHDHGREHDRG